MANSSNNALFKNKKPGNLPGFFLNRRKAIGV
jgi:hypothetical protein